MKVSITISLSILMSSLWAQSMQPQVIASSGATLVNESSVLSFTLGESFIGSFGVLDEGFHTTYTQIEIALNADFAAIENVLLFPNPATNAVSIRAASQFSEAFIYDLNGQLVTRTRLKQHKISISNLSSGTYVIVLFDDRPKARAILIKK